MEGVNPTSVFVTEWNQDIYVTDSNKHRVFVFFPNQTISIVAGNGVSGNSQDGDSALGSVLFSPDSVHVTKQNEIFISDTSNNRIKKVVNGRIYTMDCFKIHSPSNGEVYFVDRANERIKKINSQGNIQVMAGIGSVGYNGENQLATRATLTNVQDVWVAPSSGE
ncbi:hypothetical protein C9374_005897 [Naegleria lovaniensis]|uniref:NHL repeat-containing protein n=1 Tax=Naegleria lovaniensis TaxID=51637 RepID=A0AA88GKX6_NAELO|nr:uncharacterized protein C9374_005897 [Naegleria lovaniensis]KAG2382105.1 hypothetical protein C9374_005897 [Naegleria lovaniensis]